MSTSLQTFLALAIVVVAATWLVWRAIAKRKNPGCGSDCACPTDELKAELKRRP
jgi:hypothetical protein